MRQHALDLKLPLRPPRIGLNRNLCRVATRRPESLGYTVYERVRDERHFRANARSPVSQYLIRLADA
jgi:hypothetical protein